MSDPVSQRRLVCIVEDDDSVRMATANLVRALGHAVVAFASAEAFRAEAGPAPDCLVCDVNLPGMSGIALFETLRASGRRIPTIFITSFPSDRLQALAGKDVLILGKPFASAEFARGLERLLGG
ncbi:response regulator (plasmid) [Paroceanicella profunda]|uniref:Response regulator n=1 Tax=Paroceanicella profunda TaxID=2579971 RepID=A0A5B8FIV0_9RHOB|nr:response regulator [Paroceanicella profunda]QDL94221.1 response regulator [Paroceanicella profunda]